MFDDLYLSLPALICFEGDDDAGDPPVGDPPTGDEEKGLSQEKVNKILAEEKRKHRTQLEKTERQIAELLESKNLSEAERAKAEEAREDILKQLRTKEEQAKLEKKKIETEYEAKLSAAEKRAIEAEQKYQDSTIARALQDAAVAHDAFNPSVLVTYLRGDTKMNAEGDVVVEIRTTNDEGNSEVMQMSPAEAVARMKDNPDQFGGLFKSNVVSGVGGSSGGANGGKNGKIDPRKLSTAEYMRQRREDKSKLGL